ncbi:unnamed protein product [Plutella xylostella]|uniref:(diamondback moth) hypothetical protein n=1 Tax=Plutella xylostella TaxID=51655 RepID=A0A8S4G5L8_PLUXY|nr:unnamed protein product [Plutella xylostella]
MPGMHTVRGVSSEDVVDGVGGAAPRRLRHLLAALRAWYLESTPAPHYSLMIATIMAANVLEQSVLDLMHTRARPRPRPAPRAPHPAPQPRIIALKCHLANNR